jgi:hypothetical protein
MDLDLRDATAVLRRTPRVLDGLLRGLPDPWVRGNEGPETFSPFDVVGHLIHGERTDWMPRVRLVLEFQDGRPFEPFDRFAQIEASRGKTLDALLDEFRDLRGANLEGLEALRITPDQFALKGRHPALGSVTLGQLLATWVAHDLDHVVQVARVMAVQYRDAVGPWVEYLSVLRPRS